jgi:hypothetical protein
MSPIVTVLQLVHTELLLQYQAAATPRPSAAALFSLLALFSPPLPCTHTCWTYPALLLSAHPHTPPIITCLGCGSATPAAPPRGPATHRNVRRSPAIPNALSRLHCPALPRTFERFFLCRSKTALVRTLVLCRLSLESQTSPNRIFFVNIRFRFEPK